jgi:hypothetical protein
VQVQKAEGQLQKDWWTYRAPANMTLEKLQQLAASNLGAATATGVGYAAGNASHSSPPQVRASGGPTQQDSSSSNSAINITSATMVLIQRWILAEVGLAAQQQLSQPNMQSLAPQVRAADQLSVAAVQVSADGASTTVSVTLQEGSQADVQVGPELLVTAQVAAEGEGEGSGQVAVSNQQPVGSKNQDPGISVDPQAVAQPGEEDLPEAASPACCLAMLLSSNSCFTAPISSKRVERSLPVALLSYSACSHHCAHDRRQQHQHHEIRPGQPRPAAATVPGCC